MRISTATHKTRESLPPRRATQSHGTMDWPLETIVPHSPQRSTAFMVVICARLRLMTDRVRDRLGLGCPSSTEMRHLVHHLLASGVCCGHTPQGGDKKSVFHCDGSVGAVSFLLPLPRLVSLLVSSFRLSLAASFCPPQGHHAILDGTVTDQAVVSAVLTGMPQRGKNIYVH